MATSVLDVISDFFALRRAGDFWTLPGSALYELGEEVRKFYRDRHPVQVDGHRSYLGGWPSANYGAVHGDLLLTSLLYTEHVVVRDPIYDWFAPEQYRNEHMMSARPGYLPDGAPNVRATRAYLTSAFERLSLLKPLIDRQIVILVPGEMIVSQESEMIESLRRDLENQLEPRIEEYVQRFSPTDLAVEDNQRGLFVFAGGDRIEQQLKAQQHAIRYFAREFVLSRSSGATYTAAFAHEMYLASEGLGQALAPSGHVVSALLASKVPVFSNLSPGIIAKIHEHEAFGEFRAELRNSYQGAPANDPVALKVFTEDQDREVLMPRLREAERSVSSGFFRDLGVVAKKSRFGIAAGFAVDMLAGTPGPVTALSAGVTLASAFLDHRRHPGHSTPIWTALVKHNQQFDDELSGTQTVPSQVDDTWGIPSKPTSSVTVSAGALFADWRDPSRKEPVLTGYIEGDYRPCSCGSGLKYRFCCSNLRT